MTINHLCEDAIPIHVRQTLGRNARAEAVAFFFQETGRLTPARPPGPILDAPDLSLWSIDHARCPLPMAGRQSLLPEGRRQEIEVDVVPGGDDAEGGHVFS